MRVSKVPHLISKMFQSNNNNNNNKIEEQDHGEEIYKIRFSGAEEIWTRLIYNFNAQMKCRQKRRLLRTFDGCFSGREAAGWLRSYIENNQKSPQYSQNCPKQNNQTCPKNNQMCRQKNQVYRQTSQKCLQKCPEKCPQKMKKDRIYHLLELFVKCDVLECVYRGRKWTPQFNKQRNLYRFSSSIHEQYNVTNKLFKAIVVSSPVL